jgi:membrane-associated phospholipid phosphatase
MKPGNPSMKLNKKLIANIISYAFVPPVMNVAAFYFVAARELHFNYFVLINSLLFGLLLPIIVFVILRKRKMIVNDDATIKEERTLPYLIGAFLTLLAFAVSVWQEGFSLAAYVWLIYFATSLVITEINRYWKVSAHTMGASIPLGITLFFGSSYSLLFLLILGLVFWARLTLKVHTLMQVIVGALLGSGISILILALR